MPLWREVLWLSTELYDTSEIQVVDATGMDRFAASQHCAKRTNYAFRAAKTTALIDCKTDAILHILIDRTTARLQDRLAASYTRPRENDNTDCRQ
jgi:hypothetical protein